MHACRRRWEGWDGAGDGSGDGMGSINRQDNIHCKSEAEMESINKQSNVH